MINKPNKITKTEITTAAKAAVVETKGGAETSACRAPAVPAGQIKRLIMGVDLHKRFCVVTVQLSGSAPQPAQTIATARMVAWVKQQQARYPGALFTIGYEAGPCGYWMARALQALEGIGACHVMAPELLNGRRKTDKRDSRALCAKLRAHIDEGDPKAFSPVRVPTLEEEQKRSVLRHRRALLRTYGQQVMRCRSAALLHGCELKNKFWKAGKDGKWRQNLPAQLPGQIGENIASLRILILACVKQIALANAQIERLAAQEPPAPRGIGTLTWLSLKLEVGDWKRFSGRRAVASYTGLCPGEHTTGEHRIELSIDKIGNRTVRHLLIEAAWRLARYQPDYPPIKKFLGKAKGSRSRRRAIVAVARQLAIDLWRLATGRCTAEKLGLGYKT
jgi:transposase